MTQRLFDYIIIGSGFGGSVSAMRLAEKGYRVLILERGKRYEDHDFPETNWNIRKYLWAPALRCFGFFQISLIQGLMVFHGSGVGGGSLVYANVLEIPDDHLFEAPGWSWAADWKSILQPHYATARRMLGVTPYNRRTPADIALEEVITGHGLEDTTRPVEVGVFLGSEGEEVPDPYFDGEGPPRRGCIHCGGCMVGCRHNAKNSLVKNYLYFAEKRGVKVCPEAEVIDIRPGLKNGEIDHYEVEYRQTTGWLGDRTKSVRARKVILAAGALGTLRLLFRCQDETRSLPDLSPRLGEQVRTNSETLMGVLSRRSDNDFSKGVAITSIARLDESTRVEPVRFPPGSSLLRLWGGPLIHHDWPFIARLADAGWAFIRHPIDFARSHLMPRWAERATVLLVMQSKDNRARIKLGRSIFSLFRNSLVTIPDEDQPAPVRLDTARQLTRDYAVETNGIPLTSIGESLFNVPSTAHLLGGCPFGESADEGVIGLDFQVHNYPGLYVVDGSVIPANPGINPSLTITALAEYAMSQIETSPILTENNKE